MLNNIYVAQDKGGVGKSWLAANLVAWLRERQSKWGLAVLEPRATASLAKYFPGDKFQWVRILRDSNTFTQCSLTCSGFTDFLPSEGQTQNLLVDFAPSTFAYFRRWLSYGKRAGAFGSEGCQSTFIIPIAAGDPEAAHFYDSHFEFLHRVTWGRVILARSQKDGEKFFPLRAPVLHEISIPKAVSPLSTDFCAPDGHLRTLKAIIDDTTLSQQSRTDAEAMRHCLDQQFDRHQGLLLPPNGPANAKGATHPMAAPGITPRPPPPPAPAPENRGPDALESLLRLHAPLKRQFTSERAAAQWLRAPEAALGGKKPIELLHTEEGVSRIEDVLRAMLAASGEISPQPYPI